MANITLDKLKTIVQSIVASVTRYKPNLSVNDPDDPRYVAGRLCYKAKKTVEEVPETTVTFAENNGLYTAELTSVPGVQAIGDVRTVVWDGVAYVCKVGVFQNVAYTLGNLSLLNGLGEESYPDTGEPFLWEMVPQQGLSMLATKDTAETHTVSCWADKEVVHTLPKEYLPQIPTDKLPDLGLAPVATSGSYNDLTNKPEIPSNVVKTVYSAEPDENGDVSPTEIRLSTSEKASWTSRGLSISSGSSYESYIRYSSLFIDSGDDYLKYSGGGLTVGNTDVGKYIKLQASCTGDSDVTIRIQNSDGEYFVIYPNGQLTLKNRMLKVGHSGSPSIIRYVKTPEKDFDAANKAYVDGKISDTEIILASSTEGSTKQFKITVDDTGTLSATEVTT